MYLRINSLRRFHSIYLSFFLSVQENFSVEDFSGTTLPRSLKLRTNLEYHKLYCVFDYHFTFHPINFPLNQLSLYKTLQIPYACSE